MKKPSAKTTNAKNLEDKFERGEEVLDYFDTQKAKVIHPSKSREYSAKDRAPKSAVVREDADDWKKRGKTSGSKTKGEFMDVKSDVEEIQRRREGAG